MKNFIKTNSKHRFRQKKYFWRIFVPRSPDTKCPFDEETISVLIKLVLIVFHKNAEISKLKLLQFELNKYFIYIYNCIIL